MLPAPAITTLRTSLLPSATLSASTPAAYISGASALRCSGLLSVRIIVWPWLVLLSSAVMRMVQGSSWSSDSPMAPRRRSQGLGR